MPDLRATIGRSFFLRSTAAADRAVSGHSTPGVQIFRRSPAVPLPGANSSRPVHGRLKSLDGLRGIAALVVLLHHGLLPIPEFSGPLYSDVDAGSWNWLVFSPLHFFFAGTEAVLVFFVLSGFVLARPVLGSARFSWRAYYPSRLCRIYIPVLAAVCWAALLCAILPRSPALCADPSPWMRAHAQPLTPTRALIDSLLLFGSSSLNGPLWSLRWELIFSLSLPLYAWLGARFGRHWLPLLPVIAALAAVVTLVGASAATYLLTFGIGVLFAAGLGSVEQLARRVSTSRRAPLWWVLLFVVDVLLLTARWTLVPILPRPWSAAGVSLVVLGAAGCLFLAVTCPLAGRVLTTRGAQWLGAVSFSLYLTHEPIVVAIAQILPTPIDRYTILVSTPVSLAFAAGFTKLVERPAHGLSTTVRGLLQRAEDPRTSSARHRR